MQPINSFVFSQPVSQNGSQWFASCNCKTVSLSASQSDESVNWSANQANLNKWSLLIILRKISFCETEEMRKGWKRWRMGSGGNNLKAGKQEIMRFHCRTEGQLWDNDDEAIMSWVVCVWKEPCWYGRDEGDRKSECVREKGKEAGCFLLILSMLLIIRIMLKI